MRDRFCLNFILLLTLMLSESVLYASEQPKEIDHSRHQGQGQLMDHSMHQGHDQLMDHSMHQKHGHGMHDDMLMTRESMVMNANDQRLPDDCLKISRDYEFTVEAGTRFADEYPGTIFAFNEHQFNVEPCSRITINFKNNDEIRHQWMVHGLPGYLYPQGMFHMETVGNTEISGTFIVPSDDKTYLVHCDIAQHMEKGMKAQLVVGKGSGNLPSIPGVSGVLVNDRQDHQKTLLISVGIILLVLINSLLALFLAQRVFDYKKA